MVLPLGECVLGMFVTPYGISIFRTCGGVWESI